MKLRVGIGLVGALVLGCLFGTTAPSCQHGVACLAPALGPFNLLPTASLVAVVASLLVAGRVGWTTLCVHRALRRLPRAEHCPEWARGDVECITSAAPAAFCAGTLRPRVYVTDSLVELLSPPELAAVIAHERAHAQRRDPLQRSLLAALSDLLLNAPWVLWLRHRQREQAEISADRAASALAGPDAVANALSSLMEATEPRTEAGSTGVTSRLELSRITTSAVATAAGFVVLLGLSQAALVVCARLSSV
jgi:Zn-dependent protease with chaperone function